MTTQSFDLMFWTIKYEHLLEAINASLGNRFPDHVNEELLRNMGRSSLTQPVPGPWVTATSSGLTLSLSLASRKTPCVPLGNIRQLDNAFLP